MGKNKKTILVLLMLLMLIINPIHVNANNTGGGNDSEWGDASELEWGFVGVGVRLSLYKYDGKNLNYYGFVDHCSSYSNLPCPKGNSYQDTKRAGKVAHQQISDYMYTTPNWSMTSIVSNNTDKFPDIGSWSSVEAYTKEYFSLNSNNKTTILEKIKNEFSSSSNLTTSDLANIYITIEPTMRFRHKTDTIEEYFYGTAYEFARYFNGASRSGLNNVIYYALPEYMMSQTMSGVDSNNFIGNYVKLVPTTELSRSVGTEANRLANVAKITSTDGYGINVFWLGSYVTNCVITESTNKLDYVLTLSGNTTNITYGISNQENKITNSKLYRAQSSDTMIYGVVKDSEGNIVTTCSLARTPYSCTITKNSTSDSYNLVTSGDLTNTSYGISNVKDTINNKKTYVALNKDTKIYGVIKNSDGDVLASCNTERIPYSCTITTTDNKVYSLSMTGDLSIVNYGISNIKDTINGLNKYTSSYNDTIIYGTIKYNSGDIVATCNLEREKDTCSSTCANKEGDGLLSCAEAFCSISSTNSNEKRTCINTCGIEEPKFSSCVSDTLKNGKDTECGNSTTSAKTTCEMATLDNYYKIVCQENSNIVFPDNLPTILKPGMSFSYSPVLSGDKICKLEFETEKWIFDYVSSYTMEEKENLLNILKKYNIEKVMNDNSNIFKYNSSDAEIKMTISLEDDVTTNIKLFAYNTTNLLNDEIEIISGNSKEITVYANGIEKKLNLYELIQTTSSNKTIYNLKGICISAKDESIYDAIDNNCNDNDTLLYEYITSRDIKPSEYDTLVQVSKPSSNLSVNNTCYYGIENIENPSTSDTSIFYISIGMLVVVFIAFASYRKNKANI